MQTQEKTRATRGTVTVEEKQGKWRLRLPRAVAQDSARYISTRLDATPENFKKAQAVAWQIEEDIRTGLLDPTLERYLEQFKPKLRLLKPTKEPGLGELWEMYCEYRKPQVAVTTFKREYLMKYANHIAALPTKDLTQAVAIRNHLVSTLSPGSAKRMLTQLSACCKWSVKSGLIKQNPFTEMAAEIKTPKVDVDAVDPFTKAERDAIIEAFAQHPRHKHYAPFVRFLFLTGCRTGEAIALQWKHINQDCTQITFCESYDGGLKVRKDTKTHISRKFPCNPVLRDLLLSIKPYDAQPERLVFTTYNGLPIDNHRFTNRTWRGGTYAGKTYKGIVTELVKQGKVERYRCFYNTRHTFITMALEAGVTVPQVAKLAGNSPEVIMRHYAGNLLKFDVPVV